VVLCSSISSRRSIKNYKIKGCSWYGKGITHDVVLSAVSLKLGGQLKDVAAGIEYLHEEHIVHGDIRGVRFTSLQSMTYHVLTHLQSNIFVDQHGHACLADFGLVVVGDVTYGHFTTTKNTAGSIQWTSPERIASLANDDVLINRAPSDDVWAFGCTCIEVR
jgi:serine/threonine protein kinase